jgi:exosortase
MPDKNESRARPLFTSPVLRDEVRFAGFLLALTISGALFRSPLATLARLSLDDERYSCASLTPLLAGGLIVARRTGIFGHPRYCPSLGLPLLAIGAAIAWRLPPTAGAATDAFALRIFGVVLFWAGSFLLFFGLPAARRAAFPLGLLFLTVPVPLRYLIHWIHFLQYRSADTAAVLFPLLGIPALRQGLVFALPGFEIEIAEQCSGIRSSTALVLASGLAGYFFLRAPPGRLFLVLITIPVVILRNAIRIVTLSGLAVYVSRGFLFGHLHHYGGLLFSLLDITILAPLLFFLHHSEERGQMSPGTRKALPVTTVSPLAASGHRP